MPNPRAGTINVMLHCSSNFRLPLNNSSTTNKVNKENTTEVVVNLLETKGYADQDAHACITTHH